MPAVASLRRLRSLLAAAAVAVLVAGCGGGGSARAPATGGAGAAGTQPSATPSGAGAGPGAAGPRPPTPGPATADPAVIAVRARVPVLTYHQVRDRTAADGASARPLIVPPARFAAQMDALARAGYHTVSGEELVDHLATGAALPPRPVLVTFDDGSEGQWANAVPVLRRHGFRATFFVMTVVLDKPRWLSRAQVRALDRTGMTIASHTWDHHDVARYAGDDWRVQLDGSARELAGLVGHPVRLFAYPYGSWSRAAFPHLRQAGYVAAFQLAQPLDRTAPLYTIRRIMVDPSWDGPALLRQMRADF
ncbi:MAG TPA: polysaccharide deacetylase family protein [Frankiaceae bacterium]|nr:polysaccharide deacetylase family protein [Frankiaceae bacterium]